MSALTLEQQKDLARRMEEGYRFGNEVQALEARDRTPEQRWAIIEMLQSKVAVGKCRLDDDLETNGLVLAQRRFMKLRALANGKP